MGLENEDRANFRAPVVELCEGTLRFCDAEIRVRLLNQSATGFKLATEDRRLIPDMIDAVLDMDDGVCHGVQIRHVKIDGGFQILGIQRLETRLRRTSEPSGTAQPRRMPFAKAFVVLLFIAVSALAIQAAPVRDALKSISSFRSVPLQKAAGMGAGPSKHRPAPTLHRDHPYDFHRYLEVDTADWLQLETVQRRVMRSLLDACGGARENRLTPAQRAFEDFAVRAAMLEMLQIEQRGRLEKEFDRPLSGSALLQEMIKQYSSQASTEELSKQFGVLLVVSPAIAAQCHVPQEVVAAVCKQVDEAFQPSAKNLQPAEGAIDADQIVGELSQRMRQLETECRPLLTSPLSKTAR